MKRGRRGAPTNRLPRSPGERQCEVLPPGEVLYTLAQATRQEDGPRTPPRGRTEGGDWRVRKFKPNSVEGAGSGRRRRRHLGSRPGPGGAGKEVGKAIGSCGTARSLCCSGRKKVPGGGGGPELSPGTPSWLPPLWLGRSTQALGPGRERRRGDLETCGRPQRGDCDSFRGPGWKRPVHLTAQWEGWS